MTNDSSLPYFITSFRIYQTVANEAGNVSEKIFSNFPSLKLFSLRSISLLKTSLTAINPAVIKATIFHPDYHKFNIKKN